MALKQKPMPWQKVWNDRELKSVLENRLSPAATGILYYVRLMAGSSGQDGRLYIRGELATRPSLLAYLKRQFGSDITEPLAELFDNQLLTAGGRWNHVVCESFKEDQAETPAAKRKRLQRERNDDSATASDGQVMSSDAVSKSSEKVVIKNGPINTGEYEVDSHRTVTGQSRTEKSRGDRDREKEDIKSELPSSGAGTRGNVVSFPAQGRGSAPPPSRPPCSVSGSVSDQMKSDERRGDERRGEETRPVERSVSSVARWGGRDGGGADWQSFDIYSDPSYAAHLITGEFTKDMQATVNHAIADLGNELFMQAVSELRHERIAGKARKPGAVFNGILNRYRREFGKQERHSRRMQG